MRPGWGSCSFMIRHVSELPNELRTSVCIVGAGAAGIAIATALSRAGVDCAVLESGLRNFDAATQSLYKSELTGVEHGGIHTMRFRVFGGSTTRWAGQALPLLSCDFERRPWINSSGWPIGPADLEPYYRKAAEVMQVPPAPKLAGWLDWLGRTPDFDPEVVAPAVSIFSRQPNFAS